MAQGLVGFRRPSISVVLLMIVGLTAPWFWQMHLRLDTPRTVTAAITRDGPVNSELEVLVVTGRAPAHRNTQGDTIEHDLDWLDSQPLPYLIYEVQTSPDVHSIPIKHDGGESSFILQFIIDYYDALPLRTVFIHGHRESWHQDRPMDELLAELCFSRPHFPQYVNLNRKIYDDATPDGLMFGVVLAGWRLMEPDLGSIPDDGFVELCCAQFVVHRERIRRRPRSFYRRLLDAHIARSEGDLHNETLSFNGRKWEGRRGMAHNLVGYMLERTWHYIFGEPAHRWDRHRYNLASGPPLDELDNATGCRTVSPVANKTRARGLSLQSLRSRQKKSRRTNP